MGRNLSEARCDLQSAMFNSDESNWNSHWRLANESDLPFESSFIVQPGQVTFSAEYASIICKRLTNNNTNSLFAIGGLTSLEQLPYGILEFQIMPSTTFWETTIHLWLPLAQLSNSTSNETAYDRVLLAITSTYLYFFVGTGLGSSNEAIWIDQVSRICTLSQRRHAADLLIVNYIYSFVLFARASIWDPRSTWAPDGTAPRGWTPTRCCATTPPCVCLWIICLSIACRRAHRPHCLVRGYSPPLRQQVPGALFWFTLQYLRQILYLLFFESHLICVTYYLNPA